MKNKTQQEQTEQTEKKSENSVSSVTSCLNHLFPVSPSQRMVWERLAIYNQTKPRRQPKTENSTGANRENGDERDFSVNSVTSC